MPGRKPKPTALKIAEGNPGKRPINEAEPTPTGTATCPPGLPAAVRKVWRRYAPRFEAMGLLTDADELAFAMLCDAWAAWQRLVKLAQTHDTVEVNGQRVGNPYRTRADKEAAKVQKLLAEFGATPSARSRIAVRPPTDADGLDQFFNNE